MLFTGELRLNPIAASLREWTPLLLVSILAALPLLPDGAAQAQNAQPSTTPAQPTGITNNTDSGIDDDLITSHTSITVTGVAASGATVALTAAATRNGVDYTTTTFDDSGGVSYAITLNLATATNHESATIAAGSIDGAWNITALQTEPGKEESEPSTALTITIDTQEPSFNLWVGYPDGRSSGTATRVTSMSSAVRGLASHNGELYAVDDDTNALRRVDIDTGEAETVGSFGSVEASPAGLASHHGVLHMVGGDSDALYSLDTATGQATRIGSFGSTEPTPTGLASHDGVLYMIGDDGDALYQIDTTNGTATQVGSLGTEQAPAGLASHNGILYMVGSGNNALYKIDTADGSATRINGGADSFDVGETSPSGLTSHNGVLYMAGAANSALYSLSTGLAIPQPVSGVAYLSKTTVVVRISGIDEPGGVTATRTIFGNTATWSGEAAVATFRDYDHESDDGPGTVTVEVSDAAGNSASMSQDIVIDTTAPMLTIDAPESATGPFTATFRFSEDVIWLDPVDITVEEALIGTIEGSGSTYTALITPFDPAVITITVPARAVVDLAGNIGPRRQVRESTRYDPPTPVTVEFTLATYEVEENAGTLALTLSMDKTPQRQVVVPITVQAASTATAALDYTLPDPSSVTFAADATGTSLTQTYTLTITNDDYDEPNETIVLGLGTLPANVSAGAQATATVTITDDDSRGIAVSMPPDSTNDIPEGGTYEYGVALSSMPTATVTVTLSVSPQHTLTLSTGGATPAASIDLSFSTGSWSTPQTVTATSTVDPDSDDDTVMVTHTASGGDYQSVKHDETFTVLDNNVAPAFNPTSYDFDLSENLDGSSSPVNVGTPVSASDSDADDSVSYTITGGNTAGRFAIHSTSGQITYVGAGEDFESSTTSYTLTVSATGGTGDRAQSATATVTVTIADIDDTPPTVTSTSFATDGNAGYAKEGNTLTVTFQTSEELNTTPSATIAGQTSTVTGSDKSWTATYTVEAGINDDNAAFDLGVISDDNSNTADPAAVGTGITIDTAAPAVGITGLPDQITGAFTATFTFNENVTGFDSDDITILNGTLGTVAGSGSIYTSTVTPDAQGIVTITVRTNAAQDQAGNAGPLSPVTASSAETPVTVQFASATHQATESDVTFALSINLDQTPRREVVVPIAVQPASTATNDSDYTLPDPSSVTFAADATGTALTQTYTLTIIDDDYDETNETVILGFGTLPANVSAGTQATTKLTITDGDTRGIAISTPPGAARNIPEGGSSNYSVTLTSKPTASVTIRLSVSPQGTLTFATDAATPADSIDLSFNADNWSASQAVIATASVDSDDDDLTVTIAHTASGGDYQGLKRDEAFTIVDNNSAPVFSPTSYNFNLPENLDGSSSPINVGTPVSASDSDADDSVSYTITGGNTDDKFSINSTSGQVTYAGTGEDFESTTTSFSLIVTAIGGTGGRAQSATATVTVNITNVDETPPTITSTSFVTDGNTGYAREGNTITVTFQTSEELSATPSATIAQRTATVTGNDKTWTATYTVESGVNAANAAFDLGLISDDDGNEADPPAADTGIVIDTTAPSVTEVTPVTTPTIQPSPSYVFISNEAGEVTYSGTCGNGSATNVEAETETTTVFSSLLVGSYADCQITVTDAAGNSGTLSVAPFTVQLEQSAAPAQPSGITDATDSGVDDDLITSSTSIDVMGVAANGAAISLTASATRDSTTYAVSKSDSADAGDGGYVATLDLATAATDDSTAIPTGSIDGAWNITVMQTEAGKRESEASPALTITIDTQEPTFKLWVGFPDGQNPGTAIRVGSISSSVTGLASHKGTLYSVDDGTDALYSVDLATGDATIVGSLDSTETAPAGLASHNDALYMVGDHGDALYSLDTSTGEATLVGSFGSTEASPTGLASHDGVLYITGDDGDALYSIDPDSGAADHVSSFGAVEQTPAGLASHNGVLYMVGDHGDALYALDPSTGELALVGSFDSAEQTPTGLTSHDGALYLTGAANSALYTLSTGVAIPRPIGGVAYLRKGTVFVRISGIDDPGTAVATRTVLGDTDQQSGETSALTFDNYDHDSDGTGTVVVEVTDAAGDSASMSQSIVIDTSAPRLTISSVPTVTNESFTAVFKFSEVVAGFDADGIMVENGTLSMFDAANAPLYSALITPTDQGEVTITVAAESVTDKAGNAGPRLQASKATQYDTHAPNVVSTGFVTTGNPGYAKANDTITVAFRTSEDLNATPSATIADRTATMVGSGADWEATYIVEAGMTASNAAFDLGRIADDAGNTTDQPAAETGIEIDTTAPTVSYAPPASMKVDIALLTIAPTDAPQIDGDFDSHSYRIKFGSELPPGLSLDEVSGSITGTPTTATTAGHDTIVVVADAAGNIQETAITFPAVDKGTQPLTGFSYDPSVVTFGGAAPVLTAPTGSHGDLSYASDTPSVCTVAALTGELTIVGAGTCTITVTAAATHNYEEETAQANVTVNPIGVLSLTLNTIAGDNTINATEKAAGLSITGNTGAEPTVDVTVTVGTARLASVISDSGGAWLVPIPADASYLVEPSVNIRVTAAKAGFTDPTPATRTVDVDITSPSVSYTAPSSLTVGVAISDIDPTDADPIDDDYASHEYAVGPGSELPPGLMLDGADGGITGTPTTASTGTQTTAIAVTDTTGNIQEVLIVFPLVAKGSQSLGDFSYNPTSISFGDPAPELTEPTGAPSSTISYAAETPLVCAVDALTGSLTILGNGVCTITVTASETDDYREANAQASVSVSPAGTLPLSVDPITGDGTVNAAEKSAGFAITGRTGFETSASVTVAMGTAELAALSDSAGIWSIAVPAGAPYVVDPSVSIEVTASKAGFIDATTIFRTVTVDTTAPSISVDSPDQSHPAQSREFSAGDDDLGPTAWRRLVQSEDSCPALPPDEAISYTEGEPVTFAAEEFNTMHVCFWSTDSAGNVGSRISARIAGIDNTAPTVGYATPASMRVGEEIAVIAPTDGVPTDDDFASHTYGVNIGSSLPTGLSLDNTSGHITGTPTTAGEGQTTTIVVTDVAGNIQEVVIIFPEVTMGYQSLSNFAYDPSSIVLGDPAPALVAPSDARGDLSYASNTPSVCLVETSTGALTIISSGTCTIAVTVASTEDYEKTAAETVVTVHPSKALGLTVNTIAGDDTINAEEKAAGFFITGNAGLESDASVTVAVGSFRLTATSGTGGAWSVAVPGSAPYLVEPSVALLVSADKKGFPQATSVARTLAVDTTAPTVRHRAPESMRVGEVFPAISPVDDSPTDSDFASHNYKVKTGSTLPPGLSLASTTGRITGAPTAATDSPQTTVVVVTDRAGNLQETLVTFPPISKGHQSLTGFAYDPSSIAFGDPAPALMAPIGAPGAAISYISNSPSVCGVDASTGALTIIGAGTCTITATASSTDDYDGAKVQTTVIVSPAVAIPPINLAPVAISTLGDHRLTAAGPVATVEMSAAFRDPDGDVLTYTATSADDGVAAVSAAGSTVAIRPLAAGWTTVTVTARDLHGLAATQTILITVSLANQAPITVGTIAARTLTAGGRNVILDMSSSFRDPDGDALIYAAASADSTVVRVRLSGSVLTIMPVAPGTAMATVLARDTSGLMASQSIPVTVAPVTAVSSNTEVAEAEVDVDDSGAVTLTIRAASQGRSTITVMAPADDGASTIATIIEAEVGKDVPAGALITLPDSIARGEKTTTLSLLLSNEQTTPPADFSSVLGPLIMDIALSATTPGPVTACLPTDPEAGPRMAVLLLYDESTAEWEDVSETPGIGPFVNGARALCADTKGSSTLAVAYAKNKDATLSALSLDALSLRPFFKAGVTEYQVSVDYEVENVTVTAVAADAGASVVLSSGDSRASTTGHQVPLQVGENVIRVTVTAEDASVTGTYTITVSRAPSLQVISAPSGKPDSPGRGGV